MAERRKTKRWTPIGLHKKNRKPESVSKKSLSNKHLFALHTTVDPNIEMEIIRIQSKPYKTVEDVVLLCMLRFRQIRAVMKKIPKNEDAWLNFQLHLVWTKLGGSLKYLTDKDIKRIIIHVRSINAARHQLSQPDVDPDLPSCFYWNTTQVGEWLRSIGFSHLREMFEKNCIVGRKLISVDASALSKMGLKYFNEIQKLAAKIREILKIHRPNMMRALLRRVPFEHYLRTRQWSGEQYDDTTFELFCSENGYPYQSLKEEPLGLIECTCQLAVYLSALPGMADEDDDSVSSNVSDHNSLVMAPTVEFTVRHILIRDKVVSELIDELLDMGATAVRSKKESVLRDIFEAGFAELGLCPDQLAKRIEFGRLVAEEMLREARRTQEVLNDINKFREFLKDENISEDTLQQMRDVASEFFNSAANVGSLLAFGELDLENIFRQEPEFTAFVDGIIGETESKLNEMVPESEEFVNGIIEEAKRRVMAIDLSHLESGVAASVRDRAGNIFAAMSNHGVLSAEEAKQRKLKAKNSGASQPLSKSALRQPGLPADVDVRPSAKISDEPPTTIGYFTVQNDPPNEALTRKFRGEKENLDSDTKVQVTLTQDGSGDVTREPHHSQYDFETHADTSSDFEDDHENEESNEWNTVKLILDHVVKEVIQEALTQALLQTESGESARKLMICLERYKNDSVAEE